MFGDRLVIFWSCSRTGDTPVTFYIFDSFLHFPGYRRGFLRLFPGSWPLEWNQVPTGLEHPWKSMDLRSPGFCAGSTMVGSAGQRRQQRPPVCSPQNSWDQGPGEQGPWQGTFMYNWPCQPGNANSDTFYLVAVHFSQHCSEGTKL